MIRALLVALLSLTLAPWYVATAAELACATRDVVCLFAAIHEANANGEADALTLLAASTFSDETNLELERRTLAIEKDALEVQRARAALQAEAEKLKIEQDRLDRETEQKKEELKLQRDQFEDSKQGLSSWAQIVSPIGIAVLTALVGLLTAVYTGFQNHRLQAATNKQEIALEERKESHEHDLTKREQESSLLLKIAEAHDETERAKTILFYARGKYLTLDDKYVAFLEETAKVKPGQEVLPGFIAFTSSETARRIAQSLAEDKRAIGIMVWRHINVTNWDALKREGIAFALVKATEGLTSVDPRFADCWTQAKKTGIVRGDFHFFHDGMDPVAQAKHFTNTVAWEPGDLPPIVDFEPNLTPNTDKPVNYTSLRKFLEEVQRITRQDPIIYTGYHNYTVHMSDPPWDGYRFWLAESTADPKRLDQYKRNVLFWHYSDSMPLPGISGHTKASAFRGTPAELQAITIK